MTGFNIDACVNASNPILTFIRQRKLSETQARETYVAVQQFRTDSRKFHAVYPYAEADDLWTLCCALSVQYRWPAQYTQVVLQSLDDFLRHRLAFPTVNHFKQTAIVDELELIHNPAAAHEAGEQLARKRDIAIESALRAIPSTAGAVMYVYGNTEIRLIEERHRPIPGTTILAQTEWAAVHRQPNAPDTSIKADLDV